MNYFIAGTDTGVGKTLVTCGLLEIWRARHHRVAGMKPVAAGVDAGGRNEDVDALAACSDPEAPPTALNPYLLAAPTSPHIAARLAGQHLDWSRIEQAYQALTAAVDIVLIEGAGGWRVPLNEQALLSELPRRLQLPVILVAGIRLGAINHTLLTVEAIIRDDCHLSGWIANIVDPDYPYAEASIETLRARIDAPCLATLPWLNSPRQATPGTYLTAAVDILEARHSPAETAR